MIKFLNYVQEQPRSVLALVGMAAAVWLYIDMQAMMRSQTEANLRTVVAIEKLTEEVRVNSVRLEHLEREHEQKRATNPSTGESDN